MKNTKNICLVSSQYLPHVGGVENYVYNLSRELAKRGHSISIVTSHSEGLPEYERDGNIEIFRLPSWQFMNGRFPVLKSNRKTREFAKEFKKRKYDIMLVNMRFYFISLFALKLAKKTRTRVIMLDHGSSHLNTGGKLTSKIGEMFEHWITWREKKYCKEFAGVGKTTLEWIRHFGIESSLVLSNAVDIETFEKYRDAPTEDFRAKYGIPADAKVISFVGRLTLEKGARELANVFSRICKERQDVYLFMAGGGYLEEEISAMQNLNLIMLGKIKTPEIASLLAASDIFCLPSYSEGFPTCVIEACVCKCFIITTFRGDAKEIVKNRDYGIILKDNREEPLYDAIVSVLDDADYRNKAVEVCYDVVKSNYTWEKTADKFLSLIEAEEQNIG